jgi:hypothetical protein
MARDSSAPRPLGQDWISGTGSEPGAKRPPPPAHTIRRTPQRRPGRGRPDHRPLARRVGQALRPLVREGPARRSPQPHARLWLRRRPRRLLSRCAPRRRHFACPPPADGRAVGGKRPRAGRSWTPRVGLEPTTLRLTGASWSRRCRTRAPETTVSSEIRVGRPPVPECSGQGSAGSALDPATGRRGLTGARMGNVAESCYTARSRRDPGLPTITTRSR